VHAVSRLDILGYNKELTAARPSINYIYSRRSKSPTVDQIGDVLMSTWKTCSLHLFPCQLPKSGLAIWQQLGNSDSQHCPTT